jgi:hypothetical protein
MSLGHQTDLAEQSLHVCYWGNSGRHLHAASISLFDPERTYRNQNRPNRTRSTATQLRESFCHRKGIETTFREGSPRSCAKM